MLITAVETTGDVFATGEIVEKRITKDDIAAALRADGLATTLGGVFNSFPYTCFAENVGLVRLTRVRSRYVVVTAGFIMIIIGLIPKAGAIVSSIPHPVLGGAALAMFATVAVVGIQTLQRVDFHDHRNVVIVGTSLGLAVYVTVLPTLSEAVPEGVRIIFGSGITLGSLVAILLNFVFHHVGRDRGPAVAGRPGDEVTLAEVNQMSREDFASTFGSIYQGPSWAVERAWDRRPFEDTRDLRRAFQQALFSSTDEQERELIAAYPDLGSAAVSSGDSGTSSMGDQSSLGLTILRDQEHEELGELTSAYREQFGFPLVMSVRDRDSFDQIITQGRERLQNSPEQEHATALVEISRIASHRFDDLLAGADPIASARRRP
jgi:OHCU decarboxylase